MWQHVDLVANTYTNTGETPNNGIDDDNNGYVDDVNGYDVTDHDNNANPTQTAMQHGTHCAGIWCPKPIMQRCCVNRVERENYSREVPNRQRQSRVLANGFEGIVHALQKAKARVISLFGETVVRYKLSRRLLIMHGTVAVL